MAPCGGNNNGQGGNGGGGGSNGIGNLKMIGIILGIAVSSYVFSYLFGGCPGNVSSGCGDDMDRTGLPDLALESLGGLILSTGDTKPEPGVVKAAFLGLTLYTQQPPPPETIIRYGVEPGNCWAFEGSKGNVVLQLAKPAYITGIHLEHIHKSLDPYGTLGSAPKEFQIWGLHGSHCLELGSRAPLGNFTFTPIVKPLQYFPINSHQNEQFGQVELEVLSNHGDNVTCIYRMRVHGDIVTKVPPTPCAKT